MQLAHAFRDCNSFVTAIGDARVGRDWCMLCGVPQPIILFGATAVSMPSTGTAILRLRL